MKLCIISSYFPPYYLGGDAIAAYYDALGLAKLGFEITVFFWPALPQKALTPIIEDSYDLSLLKLWKFNFHKSLVGISHVFCRNPIVTKNVKKLVAEGDFDLIHYHNPIVFGSKVFFNNFKEIKAKQFITLHDYWIVCPKHDLFYRGSEPCLNGESFLKCFDCQIRNRSVPVLRYQRSWHRDFTSIHKFVCPSSFIKKTHQMKLKQIIPKERYIHIPNGIPHLKKDFFPSNVHSISDELQDPYFIFIGRLDIRKGTLPLLNSIKLLVKNDKLKDFKLLIAGNGPLYPTLKKFVLENKLNKQVVFLGKISSVMTHYLLSKSLFSVVPSIWFENNSLSILESLSYGKPVITTNIGGNGELIKDKYNGLLVPPNNYKELSNAIKILLTDHNLLKVLSDNSKKDFLRNYDLKVHSKKLVSLYSE